MYGTSSHSSLDGRTHSTMPRTQRTPASKMSIGALEYPSRCVIKNDHRRASVRHPSNISACYVAIGLMTIPSNCLRRESARETWLQNPEVGQTMHVRYLIRASRLPNATQLGLIHEHTTNSDMLFLPVDANEHVLRGRILVLLAWLRAARSLFPLAGWICKGDDDMYVISSEWIGHLGLLDRGLLRQCTGRACKGARGEAALHGYLVWHNWNTKYYIPHTFSFSYTPGVHWRRAIDYLGGKLRQRPLLSPILLLCLTTHCSPPTAHSVLPIAYGTQPNYTPHNHHHHHHHHRIHRCIHTRPRLGQIKII